MPYGDWRNPSAFRAPPLRPHHHFTDHTAHTLICRAGMRVCPIVTGKNLAAFRAPLPPIQRSVSVFMTTTADTEKLLPAGLESKR